MFFLVTVTSCLRLLALHNSIDLASARRAAAATDGVSQVAIPDAFERDMPRRLGPGALHDRPRLTSAGSNRRVKNKKFIRSRLMATEVDSSSTSDLSLLAPAEIRRDNDSYCYAGNYHTPPLRQAEGSTEPLVNPPEAVPDPYGWLRDDSRKDPTVLDHLTKENEYTMKVNAHLEDLRQELYDELVGRIQETDFSTPRQIKPNGQYVYYSRTFEGSGYRLYCRAPVPDDNLLEDGEITADLINWDGKAETPILPGEEVYLDGNEVASGHEYSDIDDISISPSERYAAYTVDNVGTEEYTLVVKDITTGAIVRDYGEDSGPGLTTGSVTWGNDDSTLFVLKHDDEYRPYQLYEFSVDLSQEESAATEQEDALKVLFEEPNQLFSVYAWKSQDRRYLFVGGFASETSEVRYIDLYHPTAQGQDDDGNLLELPLVAEKREGVYYEVEHQEGHWLILSNEENGNKTPNFRLLISPAVPNSTNLWTILLDENGEVLFDGSEGDRSYSWFTPFSNHLALEGREGGLPQVWVLDIKKSINDTILEISPNQVEAADTEANGEISVPAVTLSVTKSTLLTFEEDVYDVSVSSNPLYDSDRVRVAYSSLTTPWQIMSIDMNDPTSVIVIKKQYVPNYDMSLYKSHRTLVTSRDGTQIPVSMVFRSDLVGSIMEDNVPNDLPVYLYGYGSYGSSLDADFSVGLLPLLDRGVVFVQAHVRGGGEMGREWYESAKYLNKKRTFDDFVDVTRWLVGQDGEGKGKITSPEKLAVRGSSAGGLLVGAAMNQAPELFRVAILDVPFVDVLCTMVDASIPLAVSEWEEWGNPNEVKYFDYILSYSPVNNVRSGAVYPSTLLIGGLHDTRVQYWEPAKFAAELRHQVQQTYSPEQIRERQILLKTDVDAGHKSVTDRYKSYRDRAFWHAFMLDQLDLVEGKRMDEGLELQSTSTSSGVISGLSGLSASLTYSSLILTAIAAVMF